MKGCAFMKKLLSVILASAILFSLCPHVLAANNVYCRINDANISAIDTSLPGVQTVGDTTYHVGVGEVLSYDTHEDKAEGTMPGDYDRLAVGSYDWVKQSSETRPVFTKNSNDTSALFSLNKASAQMAYYTFNKGTGLSGKFSVEYKVKADGETALDLRFISTGSSKYGWDNTYQIIYAFMKFYENDFVFQNASRKEDNLVDNVTGYHTYKPAFNTWITVRLDIDTAALSYDVYANGEKIGTNIPFHYATLAENDRNDTQKAATNLGFMRVREANVAGTVEFDDIAVYKNDSATSHYFDNISDNLTYTALTTDTLNEAKTPVSIIDAQGSPTGKTAYVPVRLSPLSSSEFAVMKAPIDGYSETATVIFEKNTRKYTEDFDEIEFTTAGHTKVQETLENNTTNNYMQILKSALFTGLSHNLSLNPMNNKFTTGMRLRFPNTSGFNPSDNKYLTVQLNSTANSNIVQLNIAPTAEKSIYAVLTKSADEATTFPGNKFYISAPANTDWSRWHTLDFSIENGKVSILFDNNPLSDASGNTQWSIRTDVGFNMLRFAHRVGGVETIEGISNIDDLYVDVYTKIGALNDISYTTSLQNITVPENVSVSLTDSTISTLPIKSLTPIEGAPEAKDITECGTYKYTVSAEGTDQTSTLTLTVIEKAYSMGTPYTDETTGNAVVPVFKATTDSKANSLITAQYKNGILSSVSTMPVNGSGNIVTPIISEDDAVVKAFLWDSFTSLKPVCESADSSLSSVTPDDIEEYDIVCWGDSLTYGQTEESTQVTDKSYSAYLSAITGKTVKNMGIGGETAQTIAARQGGLTIAPSGPFTLGSSAGSSVTFTEGSFNDLTGGHIVPRSKSGYCYGWEGTCYLNGIPGRITKLEVNGSVKPRTLISLTFTRSEDGEALSVNEGESRILIPNGNMVKGDINVIFIGENGWHDINNDGVINEVDLGLIIDAMIKATPNPEKTIIIGLTTGTAQSREDMEELMQAKYGQRYINMRAYLSNRNTLENAGVEVTQTDLEKIAVGALPTSLWRDSSDYVHMNSKGYEIIANKIYQTMQSLGFLK